VELIMTTHKNRRGMATLETLFVLPLLFIILFGIIEFGVVLGRWQTVTNAAREGAREAIVFRQDCDATAVNADVNARVAAYLAAANISGTSTTVAGACGGSGSDATVTVTYPYTFQVVAGLSNAFASGDVGPSITLPGTSTMRNE
jgi:Flp pilus assembly protein TadG